MSITTNTTLTQHEFEAFLLIYAAHVDYIYSEDEEEYIKSLTTPEVYKKMMTLFDNTNDYSSFKIILENRKIHFNEQYDKTYYFNLLKNVFEIDGDYARIERSFINFFEKIIED